MMNAINELLSHPNGTIVAISTASLIGISLFISYTFLSKPSKKSKAIKSKKTLSNKSKNESNTSSNTNSSDNVQIEGGNDVLRGYKQTLDGKKTTYFHRELSVEEKELLGDCTPKRIDETTVVDNAPRRISSSPNGSAWNSAGTYEERDISIWSKEKLKALLSDIQYNVTGQDIHDSGCRGCKVSVISVDEIEGDAVVMVVRGKKKFVVDMHAEVTYKFICNDKTITGKYMLSNITSDDDVEIEISPNNSISSDILTSHLTVILKDTSKHSLQKKIKSACCKLFEEMKGNF